MRLLIGVDPGLRSTGWATIENDRLRFGTIRPTQRTLAERVAYVLDELPDRHGFLDACVERMIYRGESSKGNLQGLLDLQLLAGAIGGLYAGSCDVRWAAPHEWKGSLPASVLLSRLLSEHSQVLTHAQKIELSTMPGKLDAAAAIGIVRFAAGLPLT